MSIHSLTEAARAAGFAMATSDELLTPTRQRETAKLRPDVLPTVRSAPEPVEPLGMAQRIRGFFVTFARRAPA